MLRIRRDPAQQPGTGVGSATTFELPLAESPVVLPSRYIPAAGFTPHHDPLALDIAIIDGKSMPLVEEPG